MDPIPVTPFLWSGVFDRYPALKRVSVETDISRLVWIRHRAEWVYQNNEWRWPKKSNLTNTPSYYLGHMVQRTDIRSGPTFGRGVPSYPKRPRRRSRRAAQRLAQGPAHWAARCRTPAGRQPSASRTPSGCRSSADSE